MFSFPNMDFTIRVVSIRFEYGWASTSDVDEPELFKAANLDLYWDRVIAKNQVERAAQPRRRHVRQNGQLPSRVQLRAIR